MGFGDTRTDIIVAVDGGILNPNYSNKVDTYTTFESGLKIGRFAKLDTGSLDNMDSSATPVIAGVVVNNVANAIQSDGTYITSGDGLQNEVDVVSWGLITVEVVSGDTPAKFGTVYAENNVLADYGKATTTSTNNIEVAGYFNREIKANIWEVFVQL